MSRAPFRSRVFHFAIFVAVLLGTFVALFYLRGSPQPLKKITHNGETFFTTNPDFVRRLSRGGSPPAMPAVWVAAKKPEGIRRVVLLGGSTAAGLPMVDYHLGRIIDARWRARFPGERIEVINLSMDGADSAALREFAMSAMNLDPDLLVLCAGQNEKAADAGTDLRDIVKRATKQGPGVLFVLSASKHDGPRPAGNQLPAFEQKIAADAGPAVAAIDADRWLYELNPSFKSDDEFILGNNDLTFAGRVALAELTVDKMAAMWGLAPRSENAEAIAAWWQKFPQAESEARRDTLFTGYDEHDMWSLAMNRETDPVRRAVLQTKVRELQRRAVLGWDTTDIIVAYERAQLQNPGDPLTHFTAGRLLGLRGEGERAEEAFQRGFALQPNHPDARLNYAAMQIKRGDTAAARASLDALEKFDPQAGGLFKMQAAVALREAELPQAAELLRKHLAQNPEDSESWLTLSEVQIRVGDFAGSEASRQKCKSASASD